MRILKNAYWTNLFKNWSKTESETVTIIKKIPIFTELNKKELNEVSKLLHDRTYKPEEYVFKRHAPGEGMLIIQSGSVKIIVRSEEHTSELQSLVNLVCRLLLEKKKNRGQRV